MKKRMSKFDQLKAWGIVNLKDDDGEGGGSDGGSDGDSEAVAAAKAAKAAEKTEEDKAAEGAKGGDDKSGDDDKGGLDDTTAALLKDVMKQKQRAKDAEGERVKLSEQLKTFTDALGDTGLDDIKEMLQGKKDAAKEALEKKGEYDQIVEQMKSENEKGMTTANEAIADLKKQLAASQGQNEELTVGRRFSDSAYIKENSVVPATLARKEFGDYFEMENGVVVPYTKPRGTEGRVVMVDASGDPKNFEAAIEQMYTDHPESTSLIRTKQRQGTGSGNEEPGTKELGGSDEGGDDKVFGASRIMKALNAQKS